MRVATYYSGCRRFKFSFNDCPIRQQGETCDGCDNQVWILRKKQAENTKTSENKETNNKENDLNVK